MELSREELQRNMDSADAALDRQRLGVSEKGRTGGVFSTEDNIGPLTGPKNGPPTVGQPWDVDTPAPEAKKGLVKCLEGVKYVCEYDECLENWSTDILPVEQAVALVKMYEMHVNQYHGKKKSSNEEEKSDRDREMYKEVIKERTIAACVDNRVDLLAPARFLPMPLQYQHIAKNQPAQQTPVFERIDLAHLGLHMADTTIVRKIHDMSYGGARLRDFLALNLGIDVDDKDVLLKPQRSGALKQTN